MGSNNKVVEENVWKVISYVFGYGISDESILGKKHDRLQWK